MSVRGRVLYCEFDLGEAMSDFIGGLVVGLIVGAGAMFRFCKAALHVDEGELQW